MAPESPLHVQTLLRHEPCLFAPLPILMELTPPAMVCNIRSTQYSDHEMRRDEKHTSRGFTTRMKERPETLVYTIEL